MNGKALILGDAGFIGTDLTKTNIYEPFMSSLILLLQAGRKKKVLRRLLMIWQQI